MSFSIDYIEEKIAYDSLSEMPEQLRKACILAKTTHTLVLSGFSFSDDFRLTDSDVITYIIPFLKANPDIKTLEVSSNSIGVEGAEALAKITSLHTLNLEYNPIGDAGAIALAQSTTLQNLDVGGTQIGAEGAKALGKNTSIRILNIQLNSIGDAGAIGLAQSTSLQNVNVTGTGIGAEGLKALVDTTSLHTLLAYGPIGVEGLVVLAQSISLQTLQVPIFEKEEAEAFTAALLLNNNSVFTSISGIKVTPEIENMLQINRNRLNLECKLIIETLKQSLIQDLVELILVYCGRSMPYPHNDIQKECLSNIICTHLPNAQTNFPMVVWQAPIAANDYFKAQKSYTECTLQETSGIERKFSAEVVNAFFASQKNKTECIATQQRKASDNTAVNASATVQLSVPVVSFTSQVQTFQEMRKAQMIVARKHSKL
jgi:hypothetical protein